MAGRSGDTFKKRQKEVNELLNELSEDAAQSEESGASQLG
jgi:hypothetical protein